LSSGCDARPAGISVIARVEDDRLILDLRNRFFFPEQETLLIKNAGRRRFTEFPSTLKLNAPFRAFLRNVSGRVDRIRPKLCFTP